MIPSENLSTNNTDIVVTFEQSYGEYRRKEASLASSPFGRERTSYIVHSLPKSVNLKRFVRQLSYRAEYLFVTRNDNDDFYESFGKGWQKFVDDVPT